MILKRSLYHSVQFSSVTQSCPTLWDPMNCSMPGLPVHHQLPEFTQTHVHRVSDAIQPSHPLPSPSPPAPNPSQHQSLFQWVNSQHEVAKVLEFSHPYMTTGKTIALTRWTFVGKVSAFQYAIQVGLFTISSHQTNCSFIPVSCTWDSLILLICGIIDFTEFGIFLSLCLQIFFQSLSSVSTPLSVLAT